ncbi:unnamed protein product [Closterium sp. NIES-54]
MYRNRQNTTGFTHTNRLPSTNTYRFARRRSAHSVSLAQQIYHEGRPIQFNTWLDDLQLYLLSDSRDSVSLFDHMSGASLAPPATADSATRSLWLTRDAAARLAIHNHLPLAKHTHFGQHKTAKAMYDAIVARYSSPATAALSRLILPYLIPELSAFATVEDLVTHLSTSDARYRTALAAEFLDRNPPPMYITLYFIVTRLPDSLRAVRDHILALDPTDLTVDLLEKRCSSKCKGGKSGGSDSGGGGGGGNGGGGGGGSGGSGGGSGGFGGGGGGSGGGGSSGGSGSGGSRGGATCGKFHSQHCCFSRLDDAWRAEFGDEAERPRWADLLRSGVDILALDYDAILADMYALSVSADGDCYLCVPADPGIEATALSASEFTLPARLADPSVGPVLARSSSVLPCPAQPPARVASFQTKLSCGTTDLVNPPCHAFVACTPASLFLVFPGLCLPSRPRLPRPAFLVSRGGSAPLLTPPRFPRRLLPCRLSTWTCGALPASVDRATSATFCCPSPAPRAFSSDFLRDFCRGEGILQSFTLPASTQENGIAERRIGLVMEVARTSMIHAAAPHFLWPFALRYAVHQLNLWPHVSLPETSPTLRWTGKVGDASVFQVYGSRAFVHDTSANKLSSRAISSVFLSFPPDAPGWQFYHPTWRCVLPSQDVTFDESVPFYRLFPYRTAPLPPPPLFLAPGPPPVDPLPPQGPAPSSVSQVDPLLGTVLVEVSVDSGAARGAVSWGAAFGGAASGGAEPASVESGGAEPGGAEPGGTEPEGADPGVLSLRVRSLGSPWREHLSPQQLREWFTQRTRLRSGAAGAGGSLAGGMGVGGAGSTSLGGAGVTTGAGGTRGTRAAGPGGARTRGTGVAGACGVGDSGAGDRGAGGTGAGGAGAGGAGAGDPRAGASSPGGARVTAGARGTGGAGFRGARTGGTGAAGGGDTGAGGTRARGAGAGGAGAGGAGAGGAGVGDLGAGGAGAGGAGVGGPGAGGTVQRRPFFVPPQPSSLPPPNSVLRQLDSPLPSPSPCAEQTDSFIERREPESGPASPVRAVRTGRRVPRPRPPPVPNTHIMALRPSSVPLRFPLPPPPVSSLPAVPDPEYNLARASSPTVPRLLATIVIDPLFESTAASALVAELVEFAAACRLDYATSLVAESESDCPPSVGGECALGMDVLEDRQKDFECLAAAVPHLVAMLLAPEGDPDAPDTPRSYADAITGPYSSQWQTAMDTEMVSWKSTCTYVDRVPPSGVNIVVGMWIFRVKRPPGSPPVFKARYVARGFSQLQGADFFQTFSPTSKMTNLQVLLHVAAHCDYELHSLDFSTVFLQGSLHEDIWLRCPPGFTGSFHAGTHWSLRWPIYGLRKAPRKWHDTLRMTLAALGFAPSTADPSLFLRTDTSLPPFYVLVYVDDLVFV